jgi:UDP-glucose 4-epimerase
MKNFFDKKSILITGGTGSFGSAVLERLLNTNVKEIIIFSRDEKKQEDIRLRVKNSKVKFVLGDVRNYNSINYAMKNVDYVFHAAALKQVPSCDFNPFEAVQTNIIGTENTINAAKENKIKKLVLLSTDKAVYPINAMGISKAMAEKILQAKARTFLKSDTKLCITRYGNVMASRASVIPRFIECIKEGNDLMITHPSMTRFLMSLDESIDLVFYAFKNGEQGDIFVKKSSACKIIDLANCIKKIFSSKSNIKISGIRHGEKLHETLVSREEMSKALDLGKYFRIVTDNRDLNYDLYESTGSVKANNYEDYNSENTQMLDMKELLELLKKLDCIKNNLLLI